MSEEVATRDQRSRIWFRAISDHIYDTAGIHLHTDNRSIYERRVAELAGNLDMAHLRDYYMRLRYHPNAAAYTRKLIEAITTGETYFYRESNQLNLFFDKYLDQLRTDIAGTSERLRIWSAGCSTGEEPYTLAMMAINKGLGRDEVSVLGGDISENALAVARGGTYRENSFRVLPPHWRSRFFVNTDDGRHSVTDEVRKVVEFASLNLMDPTMLELLPAPHAVFCRNVLIYFDRVSKARAIRNLYNRMAPGGILFLGHAESLIHLDHDFTVEQTAGELIYRKPVL